MEEGPRGHGCPCGGWEEGGVDSVTGESKGEGENTKAKMSVRCCLYKETYSVLNIEKLWSDD